MKAIINKIYKQPDTTMGTIEIYAKELETTLIASFDNPIREDKKEIDINLYLYSEEFNKVEKTEEKNDSIKMIKSKNISDTFCEVKGEIVYVDTLEDEIYVDIICKNNSFHIVCYNRRNLRLKKGDFLKAICWCEIDENDERNKIC